LSSAAGNAEQVASTTRIFREILGMPYGAKPRTGQLSTRRLAHRSHGFRRWN